MAVCDYGLCHPCRRCWKEYGFWHPYDAHYCGQHTMPILVDNSWQVVARPSKAAYTVVPTYSGGVSQWGPM